MAQVEVRYALPDMNLFDAIMIYLEISVLSSEPVEDLIPPEMASIRMAISGDWFHGEDRAQMVKADPPNLLFGTSSRALWGRGSGGTMFAIGFQPLAWPMYLESNAADYTDRAVPLTDLWAENADVLFQRIASGNTFETRVGEANAFFLGLKPKRAAELLSAQIASVRTAIADPDCATVDDLAARVGVNTSKLARITKTCFGFSPKMLIRRERFRRMLHRADALTYGDWRTFIESQYVDQSHLIRDFRQFVGMAPSRYMALERPFVTAAFATYREMAGISHSSVLLDKGA